ncbi:MAG TPA: DUF494 domain-containing protein [Xanthomonadaceae bacterium]|nr:DUF494 domain-containing protein [Xanthomonadaceae bacterium]
MKENVLDVLLYLFENFIIDDPESGRDRDSLQTSLLEAGFNPAEINKAFDWLDELAEQRPAGELAFGPTGPVRVYAEEETRWLDAECRGFMMFLEQNGILDAARRELVVERVLALDAGDFDLDDLKWVVLMVLFNQPDQEAACAWMENHLFESVDAEH